MWPALKVFDVVPGWVWALICAAALLWGGGATAVAYVKIAAAQSAAAGDRAKLSDERAKSATRLANETAKVLKITQELIAVRAAQEKTDADAKNTVDTLRADLLRLGRAGGAGGLRDPFATPCRSRPADRPGATAVAGGENPAEAGGLLSAQLEGLLLKLASEADDINVAYASCRADSLTLREKLKVSRPQADVSTPPGGKAGPT
jgi:hypothetical protein